MQGSAARKMKNTPYPLINLEAQVRELEEQLDFERELRSKLLREIRCMELLWLITFVLLLCALLALAGVPVLQPR